MQKGASLKNERGKSRQAQVQREQQIHRGFKMVNFSFRALPKGRRRSGLLEILQMVRWCRRKDRIQLLAMTLQ